MKRHTVVNYFGLFVIMLWLLTGFVSYAQEGPKEAVRVRGSDSMAQLVTTYATEFQDNHPNCNIVVSGGPTGTGFETLLSGENDIAMMSERPTQKDLNHAESQGIHLQEVVIGWGGIVVITHPDNPVPV